MVMIETKGVAAREDGKGACGTGAGGGAINWSEKVEELN